MYACICSAGSDSQQVFVPFIMVRLLRYQYTSSNQIPIQDLVSLLAAVKFCNIILAGCSSGTCGRFQQFYHIKLVEACDDYDVY